MLTFRLFGTFEALCDNVPLPPTRTRKEQWLLALLILRHDSPQDRSFLARTLWPDSPDERALLNLRRSLTNLRTILGADASRLLSPSSRTLQFEVAGADIDVLTFEASIRCGEERALWEAVQIYRGELLEGCDEEWLLQERVAREMEFVQALETLAEYASARGNHQKAIALLRQVVLNEPSRESSQRMLMQALAECGDQAAVTQVYREFRLYLHREMNLEPSPETTALYRQLSETERVVSEAHIEHARRPNLPRPLTHLIGRQEEREEVLRLFDRSRLVTLTGAGGVGKTRLAIAVAEAAHGSYHQSVCFVELASLADPGLLPQVVASALGVRERPGQSIQNVLLAALQDRAMLLVLDNCEHLLSGCVPLIGTLVTGCPHLHILTTSRQSLGITGEITWRVPSLSVPQCRGNAPLNSDRASLLLQYDAVRLFVERAQAVLSAFHPSLENLPPIVEICRRLDGIPLAIELAAAWVRSLSVGEILHRLDDRFALLTGGSSAALPRHQTLEAAMDWSYSLLSAEERTLLRRLSVYADGWTLEAAENICADERVGDAPVLVEKRILALLTSLADRSLIFYEETSSGTGRYSLLETTKQYGSEKLTGEERRRTYCRHAAYFASWAEKTFQERWRADWKERIGDEDSNLRSAMTWEIEHNLDKAVRLLFCLRPYWEYRSHEEQVNHWLNQILCSSRPMALSSRALVIAYQGWLTRLQGKGEMGIALLEQGIALARRAEEPEIIARIACDLGVAAYHRRDYAQACAYFEESAAHYQRSGQPHHKIASLNFLAQTIWRAGNPEAGRALLETNLEMAQELGDMSRVAQALDLLGDLYLEQGDASSAWTFFTRRLAVCRELGDKDHLINALNALGHAAYQRKDYAEARLYYTEGVFIARETNSYGQKVMCLTQLARVAHAEADFVGMRARCAEGLRLAAHGLVWDVPLVTRMLCESARCVALHGEHAQAVTLFGAIAQMQETGGFALEAVECIPYGHSLADLRARLSEDAFATTWKKGCAMTREEAVVFAFNLTL